MCPRYYSKVSFQHTGMELIDHLKTNMTGSACVHAWHAANYFASSLQMKSKLSSDNRQWDGILSFIQRHRKYSQSIQECCCMLDGIAPNFPIVYCLVLVTCIFCGMV